MADILPRRKKRGLPWTLDIFRKRLRSQPGLRPARTTAGQTQARWAAKMLIETHMINKNQKPYTCPQCKKAFTLLDYLKAIGFGIFRPACFYGGLIEIKCRSCGSESCPQRPYALTALLLALYLFFVAFWVCLVSTAKLSSFTLPLLVIFPYCMDFCLYRFSKFELIEKVNW
jgi:hypothetical protein